MDSDFSESDILPVTAAQDMLIMLLQFEQHMTHTHACDTLFNFSMFLENGSIDLSSLPFAFKKAVCAMSLQGRVIMDASSLPRLSSHSPSHPQSASGISMSLQYQYGDH